MDRFSPSDAALEGFRLTREHPWTIMVWSGLYFVGVMVMGLVMVVAIGPKVVPLIKSGELGHADTDALATLLSESWPAFFFVLAAVIFLYAVFTAGTYRLVMEPKPSGLAHLRFGVVETRLAVAHTAMWAIGIPVFVPSVFGFSVFINALQNVSSLLNVLAGFCIFVVLSMPMAWIGVRLSLLTPMTFATHKIQLRRAWRMTRGHFWPLFGMIALMFVLYFMTMFLLGIVNIGVVALSGDADPMRLIRDPTVVGVLAAIVALLIPLVLPILQIVILFSPLAVAYQRIADAEAPIGEPAPAT